MKSEILQTGLMMSVVGGLIIEDVPFIIVGIAITFGVAIAVSIGEGVYSWFN